MISSFIYKWLKKSWKCSAKMFCMNVFWWISTSLCKYLVELSLEATHCTGKRRKLVGHNYTHYRCSRQRLDWKNSIIAFICSYMFLISEILHVFLIVFHRWNLTMENLLPVLQARLTFNSVAKKKFLDIISISRKYIKMVHSFIRHNHLWV